MFKKTIFTLIVSVFSLSCQFAFASTSINEFMYDLDGGDIDWVEIYNDGDDIDLTSLKLLISNSSSNHSIVKYSGDEILKNGDFGVIVPTSQIDAFISKWGSGGNIFTSSFSLPNTSGIIEINNGDKASPISSASYESGDGGAGDGKSLQLISGSWVASSPTVGEENQASASDDDEDSTDDTEEDNSSSSSSSTSDGGGSTLAKKAPKTSKVKLEIIASKVANVGIPTLFQGKAIGTDGQLLMKGRYFWNFGDGDYREVRAIGIDKFNHTYFYPGDYTIALEYYPNSFAESPEVIEQISIKVVEAGVSISKVGDVKDFFVELTNDSTYEIDISKWKLMSDFKVFIFPKNTKLGSKKKMIISSKLTNFSIQDKNTLKLVDSEGELAYDYMLSLASVQKSMAKSAVYKNSISNFKNSDEESIILEDGDAISARTMASGVFGDEPYLPIIGSVIFIGGGAGAVYIIRKRKSYSSNGDDFEILKD